MDNHAPMDKDTAGELFSLRIRGMLARMYSYRNARPSDKRLMQLLHADQLTLRDIGEIGYELDFMVELTPVPIEDRSKYIAPTDNGVTTDE